MISQINSINSTQVELRDPIHVLKNEMGCPELISVIFSQFDLQNTVSCNLVNKQWHHFAAPNIKDFDQLFEAAAKISKSNKQFLLTLHRKLDVNESLIEFCTKSEKDQILWLLTKYYALNATYQKVLKSKKCSNEVSFIDYDFLLEGAIKEDLNLVAKAISISDCVFDFVPKNLFEDLDFCSDLIPKVTGNFKSIVIEKIVYCIVKDPIKNHPKFVAAVLTHYPKLIECWQDKLNDAKFMQQALLINKSVPVGSFKNDETFWLATIDQCKDLDALSYYKLKFSGSLIKNKPFMEKYETALENLKFNLEGK